VLKLQKENTLSWIPKQESQLKKPKLFWIGGLYGACYYYRAYLPMKYITKLDCDGDVDLRKHNKKENVEKLTRELLDADIVVFQRPYDIDRIKLMQTLKLKGKKIVFENDDTFEIDIGNPAYDVYSYDDKEKSKKALEFCQKGIKFGLKFSDLAITTTDFLAQEYKKKTDYRKVEVIPNYIDVDYWVKPKENKSKEIRIGLTGSVIYKENMIDFLEVLDEIVKIPNVKLVIQGFQSEKILKNNPLIKEKMSPHMDLFKRYKCEIVPHSLVLDYPKVLADLKLDLALIPRKDNHFNRCKSNIKYLELSMLKIPVVAQGFLDDNSPYQKDIKDGENGFIAINNKEWIEKIKLLIENKKLRKEIGENAYQYVINNYDIKKHYIEWENKLLNLWYTS